MVEKRKTVLAHHVNSTSPSLTQSVSRLASSSDMHFLFRSFSIWFGTRTHLFSGLSGFWLTVSVTWLCPGSWIHRLPGLTAPTASPVSGGTFSIASVSASISCTLLASPLIITPDQALRVARMPPVSQKQCGTVNRTAVASSENRVTRTWRIGWDGGHGRGGGWKLRLEGQG
ncbi:hypothetical protein FIBSPDRAFT_870659 [Athelia psychrophila]|uniref:Uncharacterized protein n=1 Tax=Athelia psychrophila TaxID=1759441 RepID=A0A166AWS2_9AGAM|nr:hypothetical protein FIBSPDRAFT_870659 [Fibularhizoctonia sp. CBS 109695]